MVRFDFSYIFTWQNIDFELNSSNFHFCAVWNCNPVSNAGFKAKVIFVNENRWFLWSWCHSTELFRIRQRSKIFNNETFPSQDKSREFSVPCYKIFEWSWHTINFWRKKNSWKCFSCGIWKGKEKLALA